MRALFRPFALHAAYTPIETIVFFCILGTLCYFHILSAIKHSAFLDPAAHAPTPLVLRPAWAVHRAGEWVGVREAVWAGAVRAQARMSEGAEGEGADEVLEMQQVVVQLDGQRPKFMEASEYHALSLSQGPLARAVHNLSAHLAGTFVTPSGRAYADVCHATSAGADCFDAQQSGARTFVHTLAFKPGQREEFVNALVYDETPQQQQQHAHYYAHHHHSSSAGEKHPRVFADNTRGVRFEVDVGKTTGGGGEVSAHALARGGNNGRWAAYAARTLVLRFWDLARKADSLDILLILAGYVLMHTTFYLLLVRSRALGSSFWLPLAILSSAVLALLIALPIAMALRIPIDVVALTEALPFLVCTVGFDKPLRLARAVFMHPHLTVPPSDNTPGYPTAPNTPKTALAAPAPPAATSAPSSSAFNTSTTTNNNNTQGQLKPAPKIITESLTLVYAPIIRDYVLEVAVLTVGAYSKVGGLREVCALAALLLAVDCGLMCTYLAAILGVMVEVRRIKEVRAMTMTRSRANSITSSVSSVMTMKMRPSAMARGNSTPTPAPKTFRQRVKSALLGGEKGSGLGEAYAYPGRRGSVRVRSAGLGKASASAKQENPVARLKLLLIASFLTLHILNLITPLTPARHAAVPPAAPQVNVRKVDITAAGLRAVLDALVSASAPSASLALPANDSADILDADDSAADARAEIFVKVLPPVYLRAVITPAFFSAAHHGDVNAPHGTGETSTTANLRAHLPKSANERVEAFMSAWTRLVGDPILSKWITILLAISITLNGYLLKGIAAGVVGIRLGPFAGVRGAVRFEDEHEREHEREEKEKEEALAVVAPAPKSKPVVHVSPPVAAPPAYAAPVEVRVEPQSAPRVVVPAVPIFTLEDVDKKLQIAKANSRRLALETPPSSSSDTSEDGAAAGTSEVGVRPLEEVIDVFENGPRPLSASLALLNDEEVILLCQNGKIAAYALEKVLGMSELERAVRIRRALISRASKTQTLESSDIPLANYDYSRVLGACCENVVGYIPLPLGIAGPLNVDGNSYHIPMATAEGTLVASTSRGCKALNAGGGVTTVLTQDGMTRGPAIDFPTIVMAAHAKMWIDGGEGYAVLKATFESTSRFAKLKSVKTAMAGRTLFVRFATATGDAMGMNMISKGTEKALEALQLEYPAMVVLALSGNYCTDKKPAAINWIEGRGKSVVAEAVIPGKVVKSVLKTTVASLVNLNTKKNLIGSAMAGSIGGFNAHAANILTAIFLATGQDPAQNVESSMCMTLMEATNDGEDLLMTVSMPCIEVGTVGGGTVLGPQQGVLDLLGMRGAHPTHPGANAQALARLIAAAVMAGELSLISALAAGHLIRAHMAHNRSTTTTPAASVPATPGVEIAGGKGHGQLAPWGDAEKEKEKEKVLAPLTPSPSTGSLPSYSQ